MKKILASVAAVAFCVAPAIAADMATKGPVYRAAPTPVFNWSGFYVGGHAGYGWATEDWTWIPGAGPLRQNTSPSGFVGGAQAGWQQQWNNIVGGIELTWSGGHLRDSQTTASFAGGPRQFNSKLDSIFTAAARIGVAQNNWLFYGKGGFASGEVTQGVVFVPTGITNGDEKSRANGWVLGAGVEYGFSPNWIFGVEYDYIRLDVKDHIVANISGGGTGCFCDARTNLSAVLARLSYKFGGDPWGKSPVVAKY
jgi:outer membrane immunogenic protein